MTQVVPTAAQRIARGLRIGVTIGLQAPDESMWTNGIKQNALYLIMALQGLPSVVSAQLVNTTDVPITSTVAWDVQRWPTVTFEAAKDTLDVLIELGGQISAEQTAYLKSRGTYLVSYVCGSEYVCALESVLFGRQLWGAGRFFNARYDALWLVPQVQAVNQGYFETILRCPAKVVPFVWSPEFLQQQVAGLPDQGIYQPRGARPARLSVMEPNHDVLKACLNPVFIAERAYRQAPQQIELLQVTNALRIAKESAEFIVMMNQMDLVRDHKAVFLDRHVTPNFLHHSTDVVISHQWGNPLNYFYFDVCWQGYPLVHNAALASDLGYFYPDSDLAEGTEQLLRALRDHDSRHQAYFHDQRRRLGRYFPDAPRTTDSYERLLRDVIMGPMR